VTATPRTSVDETRRPATVDLRGVAPDPAARVRLTSATAARLRDACAVAVAASALGGAERALELAVAYVATREQFGRPVGSFQAVQHMAADALARIETTRVLVWWAAWAWDARPREAGRAAAMAKARAGDVARAVTRTAVEMHGGVGFTAEYEVQRYFKRALADAPAFGDGDLHRARLLPAGAGARGASRVSS
jgi:alkylation response protein AidB-like acyl-CoA dehydrogenase